MNANTTYSEPAVPLVRGFCDACEAPCPSHVNIIASGEWLKDANGAWVVGRDPMRVELCPRCYTLASQDEQVILEANRRVKQRFAKSRAVARA